MYKKTLVAIISALAVLALAMHASASQTASLQGTIVRASDRAPLAGALVNLYPGTGTQSAATATTDGKGSFLMIGLAPGKYRLEISRPLYQKVILSDLTLNSGRPMRFPDPIAMLSSADTLPTSQIAGCTSLLQPGQTADVYIVCSAPVQGY